MHSCRAALYSPLQLWGTLRRELISNPLKNCTIIDSGNIGITTCNKKCKFRFLMPNRSSNLVSRVEVKVFS